MLVGIDVIVHEASELLLERLHLVGIREVHGSLPWQILFCAAELILPRPPHQAVPSPGNMPAAARAARAPPGAARRCVRARRHPPPSRSQPRPQTRSPK